MSLLGAANRWGRGGQGQKAPAPHINSRTTYPIHMKPGRDKEQLNWTQIIEAVFW